ncbi:MAG: MFS transporter [Anaerolineaceae bacterium]|nr:MFS transporter [Anaerolineaceae bacterium]
MNKKAYKIYYWFNGIMFFAFWTNFAVNSLYQVRIAGLDALQLVLVGTALELTIFIFELPTGIVADIYSRRLSVIIGTFLIGLGFIVEGLFPSFIPILLAQIIWGLGITFSSGALEAWLSDEVGEDGANQAFMKGAQIAEIGSFFGVIFGVLLGLIHLQLSVISGGFVFLLLGIILIKSMPEEGFSPAADQNHNPISNIRSTIKTGAKVIRGRPIMISILLIGLIFGIYSEGLDRLWVAYLIESFTLPQIPEVILIGGIQAINMLLTAVVLGFAQKRLDVLRTPALVRSLTIISSTLIFSLLIFGQGRMLWFVIIFFWIIGILRAVMYPMYKAWINKRIDSSVRATIFSLSSLMDAIGQISGGPAIGGIARRFSIRSGLLGSTLLLTPVLPILGNILAKANKDKTKEQD